MRTREGTVLSRAGGRYRVYDHGETLLASLRGRMKQESGERILVGDRVVIQEHDQGATIEAILPRRSLLRRRRPGRIGTAPRPVAANVDQVIVVGSVGRPDWDPHLMDRFIAVAEASGLPAVVVLNKADLAPDASSSLDAYRAAGYPTLVTSVVQQLGLDALRFLLSGRVSLFAGSSGVGKSSLLNLLEPTLKLRTGQVSERAGTGRQTTVSAEMHPIADGGFVVDTPGLRDIGLWGVSPADVAGAFPEIRRLGAQCQFADCRHLSEPGCAVIESVERGELHEGRLDSYRRLLEETTSAARSRG
ncbi:MAG: ribosome small subunit-dependent GTPase A [Gemmatimonadetes bacterium]|nr:ribosome small subunit-dependent GTPase A [Gemmatimonadota bacterium]